MEREQKKLLLVAVSVGVFLLVTITVAIIMLTPRAPTSESSFSQSTPIPSGRTIPVDISGPVNPFINNTQETTINIDTDNAETQIADSSNGDNLTIQIPKPSTAAVPDTPDIPAASRPVVTVAPTPKPEASAPAAQPAAATRPSAPAKPATTASATTKPAATASTKPAATRAINDYWIQTGAFRALVRAEDAKETLTSKGLTSIIETRVVNGETFYRVRMGPYTSEREANNWLALVKSIDGFNESQVRQTTRQR